MKKENLNKQQDSKNNEAENIQDITKNLSWDYYSKVINFQPTKEELASLLKEKWIMLDDNQINELYELLRQERAVQMKTYYRNLMERIRNDNSNEILSGFIDKKYKDLSNDEKYELKKNIKEELAKIPKNEGTESIEFRLEEITNEIKKFTKKRDASIFSGLPSNLFYNMIEVIVLLYIFSSANSYATIILYSILSLIYLQIKSLMIAYGQLAITFASSLDRQFMNLRKLLNDSPDLMENELVRAASETNEKAMIGSAATAVFVLIEYVITLWNLFSALSGL